MTTPSAHTVHATSAAKAGDAPQGSERLKRWLPGHRWQVSLRSRKLLLWAHLLLINALCIGERLSQVGLASLGVKNRSLLGRMANVQYLPAVSLPTLQRWRFTTS